MLKNVLAILILSITTVDAMDTIWKEGTDEWVKTQIGAGLYLARPLIRLTPEQYAESNNVRVLVLGAGHVLDPHTVEPEDFRPEGGNGLRESYNGDYTYHQNPGRYCVSAEVTRSFGSDMVCDLRNSDHQKILARSEFWDLIWDDSGHVAVFEAPGLLEQIPTWLKRGGKYVIGIPSMANRKDSFNDSTASIARKIVHLHQIGKGECTPELVEFVTTSLKKIGFSEVDVRLSPTAQAVFNLYGTTDFEKIETDFEKIEMDVTPELASKIFDETKEHTKEVTEIHPVFSEASLGMLYIVATR